MSTGIDCHAQRLHPSLTGKHCTGHAMPETRMCQPCIREAKALDIPIHHFSVAEQLAWARGPKKIRMWHELTDREAEFGG